MQHLLSSAIFDNKCNNILIVIENNIQRFANVYTVNSTKKTNQIQPLDLYANSQNLLKNNVLYSGSR